MVVGSKRSPSSGGSGDAGASSSSAASSSPSVSSASPSTSSSPSSPSQSTPLSVESKLNMSLDDLISQNAQTNRNSSGGSGGNSNSTSGSAGANGSNDGGNASVSAAGGYGAWNNRRQNRIGGGSGGKMMGINSFNQNPKLGGKSQNYNNPSSVPQSVGYAVRITNLPSSKVASIEEMVALIRSHIGAAGKIIRVNYRTATKDAIVIFSEASSCTKALKEFQGHVISGSAIQIEAGNPVPLNQSNSVMNMNMNAMRAARGGISASHPYGGAIDSSMMMRGANGARANGLMMTMNSPSPSSNMGNSAGVYGRSSPYGVGAVSGNAGANASSASYANSSNMMMMMGNTRVGPGGNAGAGGAYHTPQQSVYGSGAVGNNPGGVYQAPQMMMNTPSAAFRGGAGGGMMMMNQHQQYQQGQSSIIGGGVGVGGGNLGGAPLNPMYNGVRNNIGAASSPSPQQYQQQPYGIMGTTGMTGNNFGGGIVPAGRLNVSPPQQGAYGAVGGGNVAVNANGLANKSSSSAIPSSSSSPSVVLNRKVNRGTSPPATVIISNVPHDLTAQEVQDAFSIVGRVLRTEVLLNSHGDHTGRVAVTFESRDCACEAVRRFDGGDLNASTIRVFLE